MTAPTLLGSWVTEVGNNGTLNHAVGSHTAEVGTNRMLIVIPGNEQGAVTNSDHHVTGVTYGGQAMTLAGIATTQIGTINSHASIWYLLEAGIAAATSNVIDATYVIDSPPETDFLGGNLMAHAFYGGVDQASPLVDSDRISSTTTNPLSLTLSTVADGLLVAAAAGNPNAYAWSGATETFDVNDGATGFTLSGATATTNGSDITPSATFGGTLNRHLLIAAVFRPVSAVVANPFGLLGVGRAA